MWRFILLLLNLSVSYAKIHSLQYVYTTTSEISNFPETVIVGMVDDLQMFYYDSITKQSVPKQDWVNKAADPQYWERNTGNCRNFEQISKVDLNTLKQRFNQTGGVHTWQLMYGCELGDDGSTQGYWQYGYDGEDFVTLDKSTLTYTAANPQAVITKHKWEALGTEAAYQKEYLENTCIEWLKKYVGYGKDTLERKVSPQVSLLQKDPSSPVMCHATGFYPSGVKISWQKNRQDHDEDVDLGEALLNEDGTYQKTSTLNVKPDEWKNNQFSCVVEHQDKTFRKTADDIISNFDSIPIGIIVGAVAAVVLLLVIGVVGYLVYQRKKGFKPVSGSDDGSDSSAHT